MRHRLKGKKMGRNHHQRKALFLGLVRAMFTHGSIKTTVTKAKAVLPLVEKITNKAKKGDLISKRFLYRYLQDQSWVNRVSETIQKEFADQNGNYTKITPLFKRKGDRAIVVRFEFTKPLDLAVPVKLSKSELKKQEKKAKKQKAKKVGKTKKALPKKKEVKEKK